MSHRDSDFDAPFQLSLSISAQRLAGRDKEST